MALISCEECGKEISDKAMSCPNCGVPIAKTGTTSTSVSGDEEKVLIQGLCNRIIGHVQNGHGTLTNKRFIYSKHSIGKLLVMGLFANLTKGNYEFDIPIENIKNVERRKRLFQNVLVITTFHNEEYVFYVTKIMEWEIAFGNLLSNR